MGLGIDEIERLLGRVPRVTLGHLPTPLDEVPRLSQALGGPRILVKRDDLTGLALGGNKTRQLEFLMADAIQKGADTIVTSAAAQSNMCRQTAAAAAKLGLGAVLVLRSMDRQELQGNLLLDRMFGAQIHFIATDDPYSDLSTRTMEELAANLTRAGKRPYTIDVRTAPALATLGSVACGLELHKQLVARDIAPSHLYVATSSGVTHAGLLLVSEMLALSWRIQGISVQRPSDEMRRRIALKVAETARLLSFKSAIRAEDVRVDDGYIGPAYGMTTDECVRAITLAGRTEGLVMDPVYSGKSLAGLIGHIQRGQLGAKDTVVFIHTGGAPSLFAHAAGIAERLP